LTREVKSSGWGPTPTVGGGFLQTARAAGVSEHQGVWKKVDSRNDAAGGEFGAKGCLECWGWQGDKVIVA